MKAIMYSPFFLFVPTPAFLHGFWSDDDDPPPPPTPPPHPPLPPHPHSIPLFNFFFLIKPKRVPAYSNLIGLIIKNECKRQRKVE